MGVERLPEVQSGLDFWRYFVCVYPSGKVGLKPYHTVLQVLDDSVALDRPPIHSGFTVGYLDSVLNVRHVCHRWFIRLAWILHAWCLDTQSYPESTSLSLSHFRYCDPTLTGGLLQLGMEDWATSAVCTMFCFMGVPSCGRSKLTPQIKSLAERESDVTVHLLWVESRKAALFSRLSWLPFS